MPPSVVNNKNGSVSHDDDHVKKKVEMFDPPLDDEVQPDHHHHKKPPVPIHRTSRRKTWNQKDETSPVSTLLRKTRSEVMSKSLVTVSTATSPRLLRKVKSTPSRSEEVSKLSNESGIGIEKNVGSIEKVLAESVEEASFEKIDILIDKDLNGSDEYCEEKLLIITSNVDGNECVENETIDEMDKKVMEDEEIEIDMKRCDIKEVSSPGKKLSNNLDEDVKVCQSPDKKATVVHSALSVKQPPPHKKSSQCGTKASTDVVKPGSMITKLNPSFSAPAPLTSKLGNIFFIKCFPSLSTK